MKAKKTFVLFAVALFAIALAGAAFALPITIDEVKVDGTELQPDATNRLSIDRGEEFDIRITLSGTALHEDIVAQALIAGYEHDDSGLSDIVGPFKVEANTTYTKKLTLTLPEDIDEDSYKLRLMFTDRNSEEVIENFNLKIDKERHDVVVDDIILYPQNTVDAGSALLVTVRAENFGDKDEDDVRVRVSMPELGVSATDYIDEIESDDTEETEELYLRIPRETPAGDYELKAVIEFNDQHDSVEKSIIVHVEGDETYVATTAPKTLITIGSTLENVEAGQSVIFPVTIANSGRTDTAYTMQVTGAQDWSEVKISPTTTQVIEAGTSKAFYLSIAVDKDASAGPHVMTATVTAGDATVEEVALTVDVTEKKGGIGKALGIALIVVLAILVLFGIVAGISRMRADEDYVSNQETYY
jgi:uncharacterized membrane protein